MGFAVLGGANIQCSFGTAPSVLTVLPTSLVMSSMPMASIMDYIPMVNILPFVMCQNPANPTVASATAAALGVLTPMPCIPLTVSAWAPGCSSVMVAGNPALNNSSKLNCAYGGVIQIVNPATTNIMIP
ncbi:MAG: DUF4280 domain-containing protein [Clostridia bacterium]